MSVQINGDYYLSLTRKYNSFEKPLDNLFGKCWSLDLPYLEKQKIPVKRKGDVTEFSYDYYLISPLNSYSEKIKDIYVGDVKEIGFKTKFIIKDNVKLHFNDDGFLVAVESKPVTIIYNRDSNNRIFQIAGMYGDLVLADMKIKYGKDKIVSVTGSNGEMVKYNYSNDGTLISVVNDNTVTNYEYKNDLVTAIKQNDKLLKQFNYNLKGQLLSETGADGSETINQIKSNENGYEIISSVNSKNSKEEESLSKETVQYDFSYRPVKRILDDGSVISADYSGKDQTKIVVTDPGGNKLNITKSNDNKNVLYTLPDGIHYSEEYDENGQLLSLNQNDQPLFKQKWNPDGTLALTSYNNQSNHFEYNEQGVLQRTLITPPGNQSTWNEWESYEYDKLGRLSSVSDYSGLEVNYGYDKSGQLDLINSKQGGIKILNQDGVVKEVETPWGSKLNYSYDKNNNIEEITNSRNGNTANIKFNKGQISTIKLFNGAEYKYNYGSDENNGNLIESVKTPLNNIEYKYDDNGKLNSVLCSDKYRLGYNYDNKGRISQITISGN